MTFKTNITVGTCCKCGRKNLTLYKGLCVNFCSGDVMDQQLLTRDNFRESVFRRDNGCVICGEPATAAHHILERRLFKDGGYYLDNGASLCDEHHLQAEMTTLSVEDIRIACGITQKVLPPHFDATKCYDKWGNVILKTGHRKRGELFDDPGAQRILKAGKVLSLFTE